MITDAMVSSADRMGSSDRASAAFVAGFVTAPALSLGRAEAQGSDKEDPPADQARGLVDPHPVEPVDAALLLPRVVLGFPRIAFDVVMFPFVGAIRIEAFIGGVPHGASYWPGAPSWRVSSIYGRPSAC